MLKYWPQIRKSTFFKLGVVTAISYVLYLMAGFLLPLLLAVGLAFALYPLVNAIAQVRMAHGMIKLSRVVAIILALMAFCIFIFILLRYNGYNCQQYKNNKNRLKEIKELIVENTSKNAKQVATTNQKIIK